MAPIRNLAWWILFTWRFCSCLGNLNLYLNETETRRLLGITAQLYYIRNGIINNYALSFDIPIQAEVQDIYFSWQRVAPTPAHTMFYNISSWVSNPRAMAPPMPSIPSEGVVPSELSAFRVRLLCTGTMDAEVEVKITMHINIFFSNTTSIVIKRKKVCLKDFVSHNAVGLNPGEVNASYSFPREGSGRILTTSTNVFYIAVGCACGLILLIAIMVGMCYIRCLKLSHHSEQISKASSSQTLTHQGPTFLRADTPNNSVVGMSSVRRAFSPVAELRQEDVRTILAEIQIDRSRVSLGEVIMEGTFGRVFYGHLIGDDEKDPMDQEVYIKSVTDQARLDQIETMLREACLMKGFVHPNINPIFASCMTDDYEPLLIFPYSSEGNLKKFLQKCKMSDITSHQVLNTQQLVYMAIQIIRGVQYLHRKRVVHKDLAIRNCVVDGNLVVKVTDNALARDLFPNDYHCLGDNENRPVKWLALESLLERRFSPASDVWSFGVTLWELMTLGQQPYADIDPFEMAAYLKGGYRISQPINCPDELFAVMACCWALAPDERPKFTQLLVCLQDFYTALGKFI